MDLSLIIAVKGKCSELENLLKSINDQKKSNLSTETILVDGGCLNLPDRIKPYKKINSRIIPSNDFSIYDALNTGVLAAKGNFYVVAGQDDSFQKDFFQKIEDKLDIRSYGLIVGDIIKRGKRVNSTSDHVPRLGLMNGIAASHSVGTVIRRNLHDSIGLYSNKYPVCADQLFLRKASNYEVLHTKEVFGKCAATGFSDSNPLQSSCEQFLIQVDELEKPKFASLFFLVLRIVKYWVR